MRREIGSFYEKYIINNDVEIDQTVMKFLDNCNRCVSYFSSGREAIEAVINDIEHEKKNKKSCILPLYTCDTVISPFVRHGWSIFFYDIQMDFRVSPDYLFNLYNEVKPDVLFMHTYYGCDNIKDIRNRIMKWQNEDGLIFIEDMTQSLFILPYIENIADYCVGSVRKWFPIPDGGFVLSRKKIKIQAKEENTLFVNLKIEAQKMKYDYLHEIASEKEEFLRKNFEAEMYLYKQNDIYTISKEAMTILKGIDIQKDIRCRNQNAKFLINQIDKLKNIKNMIWINNEVPLYVPILCDLRAELQKFLIKNNIFSPVLWPIPQECEKKLTKNIQNIYEKMLALPCDQRYEISDMKKIIDCLIQFDNLQK